MFQFREKKITQQKREKEGASLFSLVRSW